MSGDNSKASPDTEIISDESIDEIIKKQSDEVLKDRLRRLAREPKERQIIKGWNVTQEIRLPCGILMPDGSVEHSVTLKGATGKLDLVIEGGKSDGGSVVERILEPCIVAIGGNEDRSFIQRCIREYLLSSDVMYLLLKLREITLETQYSYRIECPKCNHSDDYVAWSEDLTYYIPCIPSADARKDVANIDFKGLSVAIEWHWANQGDSSYLRDLAKMLERRSKESAKPSKRRRLESDESQDVDLITAFFIMRVDKITGPDGSVVRFGRCANTTVSEDGVRTLSNLDTIEYVQTLPYSVRSEFVSIVEEKEPDVDLSFTFSCKSCTHGLEADAYPLDPATWRPKVRSYKPTDQTA